MQVKICGITRSEDARAAAEAGSSAIGLNFWVGSKRRCELAVAADIVAEVGHRLRVVGVFVDASGPEIQRVQRRTGLRWVQFHGAEPASLLSAFLPHAYRAVRVFDEASLEAALGVAGTELLVDAAVPGMPGGTGQRCDWRWAARLAARRRVWLAGGLTPENVAEAIDAVRPVGVDVASGVERSPGIKDAERVRAFVRAATNAERRPR